MTRPFDQNEPPRCSENKDRDEWIEEELRTMVQPDPAQMRRHIEALHERWRDRGRSLQVCADASRHETFPVSDAGIEQAIAWALRENEGQANVYVRPASFLSATGKAGALTDGDVLALPALWVDCDKDGASKRALIAMRDANLAPNFSVTTGWVPHVRRHHYLLLKQPLANVPKWRDAEGQLIALTGSDPSVANCSRMMRLAGGVAWPRKEGRTAELVEIEFHD